MLFPKIREPARSKLQPSPTLVETGCVEKVHYVGGEMRYRCWLGDKERNVLLNEADSFYLISLRTAARDVSGYQNVVRHVVRRRCTIFIIIIMIYSHQEMHIKINKHISIVCRQKQDN